MFLAVSIRCSVMGAYEREEAAAFYSTELKRYGINPFSSEEEEVEQQQKHG